MSDLDPWFDWTHPMNKREPWHPTIDELEKLLQSDDEVTIEILPNGEVRAVAGFGGLKPSGQKPLTYRENLGGEYAA